MSTNNMHSTHQCLTFSLSDELYALEVSKVKEVLENETITVGTIADNVHEVVEIQPEEITSMADQAAAKAQENSGSTEKQEQ